MAIIVVGGNSRGVGKTALVCGLIAALSEVRWTAVKITTHEYGTADSIWEETEPGQGSDTARYLAAGAVRALLVTAPLSDFSLLLNELWAKLGPGANIIFESNRILEHLKPDLCLMVHEASDGAEQKPSFNLAARCADAMVARAEADRMMGEARESKPIFHLAELEHVSPEMLGWLRACLGPYVRKAGP
jgi:hypothetical protein